MRTRHFTVFSAAVLSLFLAACAESGGTASAPAFMDGGSSADVMSSAVSAAASSASFSLPHTVSHPESTSSSADSAPENGISSVTVLRAEATGADKVKIYLKNGNVNQMRFISDNEIANNITVFFMRGEEEIARCAVHARGIVGTFFRSDHAILEDYSNTSFADDTVCWTLEYKDIAEEIKSCGSIGVYYSDFVDNNNSRVLLECSGTNVTAALFGEGISSDGGIGQAGQPAVPERN